MKLQVAHEITISHHGVFFFFSPQDPKGNIREWECAFRPTRRSECDGVAVIVFVKYPVSKKKEEILLVSQYRPPVACEVRVRVLLLFAYTPTVRQR